MPQLSLSTNVPVDAVAAADILRDCSRAFARIIGKPESGEIMSIGGLGPGVNGKLSAALADILEAKLSVSASRFYVKFDDVQGYNVGFNGTTF
ncbi:hypothetical protein CFC21_110612 [Triticum aestivum]|uniref:L-dopachrome isomerase n=2 Tax=Triticum aestivum TaxID=4565 RepID=A0A3B6TVS2_WHEAT|nr:hypothetical protein CFC21_110612 [Triticum aestivum]